ncbi:MAG TPA: PilZ domain-containing protein [Polyangiaceae bacterium]|nr:PilZ domain-containing protein [Polyangiaceae bacterium]
MVERERRAHPRKLVSTGVSFNDLEGATLRGWLRDISRGGCFVATPSLFTFGEELTIVMTLPFPRQRVVGRVRVVWVREKNDKDMPAGMGMAFVEVNDDALVAIDKLASGSKLSRPNTFIGIAPPAAGSSPSYSDVQIPKPPPAMEPTLPAEPPAAPKIEIAAPLSVTPKKSGREKWLIGGAAAISVGGLVALGVVYSRHAKTNATVDAAVSATASVSATPTASETAPSATASATASASATTSALPIIDASAPDAAPHDAGADGGKKKPKPKIRRK